MFNRILYLGLATFSLTALADGNTRKIECGIDLYDGFRVNNRFVLDVSSSKMHQTDNNWKALSELDAEFDCIYSNDKDFTCTNNKFYTFYSSPTGSMMYKAYFWQHIGDRKLKIPLGEDCRFAQ